MMKTVWERAAEADKPVLLYGTGNGADKIIDELQRLGIKVSGVFASDGFVRKRTFRGFPVMSYGEAKSTFGDFLVLVAFGSSRQEVIDNITAVSAEQELYSVDVPVYGDDIFNREYYADHLAGIEEVKNMLCDDFSRRVYENIINFKLTGRIDMLFDIQTDKKEAYDNILKLGGDEIYMDLGAFNGDTVFEFINYAKSYNKIYAVEPSAKNFKKLSENISGIDRIERLNVCVTDRSGETLFSDHGGRNASGGSGVLVKCDTVDNILNGDRVTYIKFDVEGFESRAIDGAKETIKKYRPKMLVSCYHRTEDIFALTLKVKRIRPDYRVYIRHNPYIPAWDTQFYFV